MRSEEEIQEAFERTLDTISVARKNNDYVKVENYRLLADALGWVLGEYDDDPSE